MTRRMTQTQRRRAIQRAVDQHEREAAAAIASILDKQFKVLKRDLRRANLRKRLYKADRDYSDLSKALGVNWLQWIKDLASGIRDAVAPIGQAVSGVESDYWLNRGKHLEPIDPGAAIDAYEARTGRQITGIGEDTRDSVLRDLTDWYNSDEDMPALVERLSQYFSPDRAAMIARTEAAYLSSEVTRQSMDQFGITRWNFDLAAPKGEWPCQNCIDYAAANPHTLDDPFPPLHPRDRCGVTYLDDEPDMAVQPDDGGGLSWSEQGAQLAALRERLEAANAEFNKMIDMALETAAAVADAVPDLEAVTYAG